MDKSNNAQESFSYTYSAAEQAEIRRIREKYEAPTEKEDKLQRLRRLDRSVTQTAQAVSLVFGVLGTLILGLGMSVIMTELSAYLGLTGGGTTAVGIAVGLFGGVLAVLAYPIYNLTVRILRKKRAPEILRLTEELSR